MRSREFVVRVGEREHRVAIEIDGEAGREDIVVDGRTHQVTRLPGSCAYVVRSEAMAHQVRLSFDREPHPTEVWLRSTTTTTAVEVQTAAEAALAKNVDEKGTIDGAVTAPMPGRVLKVHVASGDMVTRGQALLIVEAMKMENEITAPLAGRVTQLEIAPGDAIDAGQMLARVVGHED